MATKPHASKRDTHITITQGGVTIHKVILKYAEMSKLKVFFDSFSQPSRAVLLFIKANNITYESRMIKLADGNSIKLGHLNCALMLCTSSKRRAENERRVSSRYSTEAGSGNR